MSASDRALWTEKFTNQRAREIVATRPTKVKSQARPLENDAQAEIFKWAKDMELVYPEIRYMFATLNGVRLNIGQAVKAKRLGNKRGVPDIWLPVKRNGFSGLIIELKVKGNKTSIEQDDYLNFLTEQGFNAVVCVGAKEAIDVIEDHLSNGPKSSCKGQGSILPANPYQDNPHMIKSLSNDLKRDNPRCTNCIQKGITCHGEKNCVTRPPGDMIQVDGKMYVRVSGKDGAYR